MSNDVQGKQCPKCKGWFYSDNEHQWHEVINIKTINSCSECESDSKE